MAQKYTQTQLSSLSSKDWAKIKLGMKIRVDGCIEELQILSSYPASSLPENEGIRFIQIGKIHKITLFSGVQEIEDVFYFGEDLSTLYSPTDNKNWYNKEQEEIQKKVYILMDI